MSVKYYSNAKTFFQEIPLGVSGSLGLKPGQYLKGESTGQLGHLATIGLLTDEGSGEPAAVTATPSLLVYTEVAFAPIGASPGDDTVETADYQAGSVDTTALGNLSVTAAKLAAAISFAGKTLTHVAVETVTPVNAVAASSTITSDATAPSDGDTVTIGSIVYTFKTTLTPSAYQVLINTTAAAALINLKKAINATGVANTDYGTGTLVHPTVSAGAIAATTLVVTALTKGTAGNSIATTETSSHLSWTSTVLAGGIAGTVSAEAGRLVYDGTYLYVTVAANTATDANWRRISLGSAY